jgi:hypothetical protein
MILRNLLVALIVVMADVYVVACVSFFAIGTMKLMMAMITHLIVMVFTLFTPMPPLLLLIGQFCSRFSMFLLQECYDANLGLDIDKPQFTLSPNLNQDEEEEENQEDDDMQVFLEYDRQQVILAHIASFDRAAHRYGQEKCQISFNMSSFNLIYRGCLNCSSFVHSGKETCCCCTKKNC